MSLQAFHNDPKIKEKYLNRVIAHQKADRLIRGITWEDGKGCAIGCTLEAYDHSRYPIELGIPEWLARVEDTLFEGMTKKKSETWPKIFLKSIPVGVDLEKVKVPFVVIILEHSLKTLDSLKVDHKEFPDVVKAIKGSHAAVEQMIVAQKSGDRDKITAAAWSAESAESAAWSAARSAAWSADRAAGDAEREKQVKIIKRYLK